VPKKLLATTIKIAIIIAVVIGMQVAAVDANPYGFTFPTQTSAPDNAVISIAVNSPEPNASYSNGTITVCFNKTINGPEGISTQTGIVSSYQGDWMTNSRWCPFPPDVDRFATFQSLQYNFSITDIPFGKHTLNITAYGTGHFNKNNTEYWFPLQKTVTISFSIINSNQALETPTTTSTSEVPSPTFNPESAFNFSLNQTTLILATIIITMLAVAYVALVFIKKRKSKTALENNG
jgi:hypothetical protein